MSSAAPAPLSPSARPRRSRARARARARRVTRSSATGVGCRGCPSTALHDLRIRTPYVASLGRAAPRWLSARLRCGWRPQRYFRASARASSSRMRCAVSGSGNASAIRARSQRGARLGRPAWRRAVRDRARKSMRAIQGRSRGARIVRARASGSRSRGRARRARSRASRARARSVRQEEVDLTGDQPLVAQRFERAWTMRHCSAFPTSAATSPATPGRNASGGAVERLRIISSSSRTAAARSPSRSATCAMSCARTPAAARPAATCARTLRARRACRLRPRSPSRASRVRHQAEAQRRIVGQRAELFDLAEQAFALDEVAMRQRAQRTDQQRPPHQRRQADAFGAAATGRRSPCRRPRACRARSDA